MFIQFTKQKNFRTAIAAVTIGLVSFAGYSQDKAVELIKKDNDNRKLSALKSEFIKKGQDAKKRVEEYENRHKFYKVYNLLGEESTEENDPSSTRQLMDVGTDGILYYYKTDNDDAAKTTRTNKLHPSSGLGYNLTGEGETIGIWDGGVVKEFHETFTGRAQSGEGVYNNNNTDYHATHVGGTMVGALNSSNGRGAGMAPNAELLSYDWSNDTEEIIEAINDRNLLVSNHSYSLIAQYLPEFFFGKYYYHAWNMDRIANNAPYYLHVKAASNDRSRFQAKGGYDLMYAENAAKNILTVAAVEKVESYQDASSVKMSVFSNWGPTDDGRIKPDISGNGVGVYSASNQSNNSYGTLSGTSMAAPNVSGSLILLQQYFKQQNGFYMESAMLKGLALHTASEAGRNPGPDYEFGWGLLDAEKAAETIKNNGELSMIKSVDLDNNEVYSFKVRKNATNEPLLVSISWNDVAYQYNPADRSIDNPTPVLVNDLDIRVTDTENTTHFPWKLDPKNPAAGATKGDNIVDNIERVEVSEGIEGEVYTVTVSHKGNLVGGRQSVAVIVTGGKRVTGDCNIAQWSRSKAYNQGDIVEYLGDKFEAKNWSQAQAPFIKDQWGPWKFVGSCSTLGNNAPEINLLAPTAGTEFRGMNKVTFSAKITDADNDLASVNLIRKNERGTEIINPLKVEGDVYTFEYTPDWYGKYDNTIVAIDSKGTKKTQEFNFFLYEEQTEPSIAFLSHQEGDAIYKGTLTNLKLQVSGIYGKDLQVHLETTTTGGKEDLYQLTNVKDDQTVFAQSFTYSDTDSSSNVEFKVLVKNEAGEIVIQKVINVALKQNLAPVVELLSYNDRLFTTLETVEIKAKVTDADGSVDKVVFTYKGEENVFKKVEMTKNGDIYTASFTPPTFYDAYNNTIVAVDNRGRESDTVTMFNRIAADAPNLPPVVEFRELFEGQVFQFDGPRDIPFVFITYNGIIEGPEYVIKSEVFLNDVKVDEHIHDKKFGLGMRTSVPVSKAGEYTLKIRTLDERGTWGENQITFKVVDKPSVRFSNLVDGSTYPLKIGESFEVAVEAKGDYAKIREVRYYIREFVEGGRMPYLHNFTTNDAVSSTSFEPKNGLSTIRIDVVAINEFGMANTTGIVVYTDKEDLQPPYPNPTTGIVNIPWDKSLGKFVTYVYTLNYKFEFKKTFESLDAAAQLDLGGLKKGTYIVVIESQNVIYRKEYKIVVE
ncbi:Carbohydrate binding domain-containing protein [Tenacibaculum sp. MAR_2009_124]|uniref:S8 family serine peptidase n=1 Tax=Tenacibaculum sp. MAR_2009_124 TaxID=1250059 RepID=UPI000895854D|nr:S8 family serine peptidase [Tenacibaculum sp. MAR_2009_124]SEC49234.1 Carbohydrate binding domain-containing protein [Tenacibaculum sp. MAR_2009_124]